MQSSRSSQCHEEGSRSQQKHFVDKRVKELVDALIE